MNIVAYSSSGVGSSALYELRIGLPFRELQQHGHEVDVYSRTELDAERLHTAWARWMATQGPDIQVIQRNVYTLAAQPEAYDQMHDMGSKLVYEIDDDPTDQYRDLGYGDWIGEFMTVADAAIVSTPYLAKLMKQTYNKPVHVCFSHLNTKEFARVSLRVPRAITDKIVIGLAGSLTHWADWAVVVDALHKLKVTHGDRIALVCAGYRPGYFKSLDMFQLRPVEYKLFPGIMKQFDIVLAPLDRSDQFNLSKSGIRALESMAAERPLPNGQMGGAIPVCTDLPMYRRYVNKSTGVLVKDDADWYDELVRLVDDKVLRQNLSRAGLKWVQKNCDIKQGYRQWVTAYTNIARG